jgi:putative acetyltransferase
MSYTIRRATAGDITSLREVFISAICEVSAKDYNPEQIDAWVTGGADTAKWQKRIDEQHFYAATEANKIIGFASMTDNGYVDLLFVHSSYQGMKVATTLMQSLYDIGASIGVQQYTSDVSITAKPFFEREGFTVVKEQLIDIGGVELRNYHMAKILVPFENKFEKETC